MTSLDYKTLREKVAIQIRKKIVLQELKPGERIIEQDLAEEFQTSRGPVREALRDLENEGLIEYARNIGCSVKKTTMDDSYEIYLLRANYEIMSVKLVHGNIPEETIEELCDIVQKMETLQMDEYEKIVQYDNQFHETIVKVSGFERIHKAWSMLSFGNIVTGYSDKLDKKRRLAHQYPSHQRIIDLCRTQDTKAICEEISDHYWRTISRLMNEQSAIQGERREPWGFLFE